MFNRLVKVDHDTEETLLLKEAKDTRASVIVWKETDSQENALSGEISEVDVTDKNFTVKFDDTSFEKGEICFFSISLNSRLLLFKSEFLTQSGHRLVFKWPKEFFKAQRREAQRYFFAIDEASVIISHVSEEKTNPISDLSFGGLSFQISNEEASFFPLNSVIESIRFEIENNPFDLSGEVKHVTLKKLPQGTVSQVGIAFKNLTEGDRETIKDYVSRKARQSLLERLKET